MKCGLASAGLPVVSKLLGSPSAAQAQPQGKSDSSFAAIPGEKGVQDVFGAYDVDPNWPQPLSSLPGNDMWTWGSAEGVFAENPDRVFILQRGELPAIKRPRKLTSPSWGRASVFPSAVCLGATPRRPAPQDRSMVPTMARRMSTGAGITASSG